MKLNSLFFLVIAGLFVSCTSSNSHNIESSSMLIEDAVANIEIAALDTISENYLLYKAQCLVCHGGASNHDELIAPPMVAIQRRYKVQFDNKQDFIDGVVAWGLNPTAETALMRGAVKEFKVMPKPATKEEDLKIIAAFIYDNELEQPGWYEEHHNQMHGEGGQGMGHGKGKGMRKGQN